MKPRRTAFTLTLALAVFVLSAWAQRGRHMGMMGHHYDAAAEVTLHGTITEVKKVQCEGCGYMAGTHLMLKTAAESMEVMLGPTTFLNNKDFALTKGDEIEVTGAKIKIDDQYQLLAREVKKGEHTLTLRDKSGRPMWAGRGRRGR